jgi:hypothetical protein
MTSPTVLVLAAAPMVYGIGLFGVFGLVLRCTYASIALPSVGRSPIPRYIREG